jgi:uncharacterized protein YbaR (Trm112 family)
VNLDPVLLEILACPACHAELRQDDAASELVCTGCGLAYPVRDDIPVMLVDEARQTRADAPAAEPAVNGEKPAGEES